MTMDRIREAAMFYFSRDGYDGTSLAQIANDVGIRKASLYAHFNSKEEIFFSCLDEALQSDLIFLKQFLYTYRHLKAQDVLYRLLVQYQERAKRDIVSMFCWRSLYFPPHVFNERMTALSTQHITQIGELLLTIFIQAQQEGQARQDTEARAMIEGFLCLFDGLMIEYMHAGTERFHIRLEASWPIFCRGVFQ